MTDHRSIAPGGIGWVASVTIDAADPQALARFWSRLLGLAVQPREGRLGAVLIVPIRNVR